MPRRALGLSAESLAIDLTVRPLSIAALMFSLSVLAPLCEELPFRVSIQGALVRTMRPATAVFGTSAQFAVDHGALERVPEVLFLGLILGTLYRGTGGYWQCEFLCFVLNTIAPPLFVAQSQLPTPILIVVSVVMVPLAVAALPRAMPQPIDSVSNVASSASRHPRPRGLLAGISLLVLGALGIETSLHVTGAFTRKNQRIGDGEASQSGGGFHLGV